MNEPYLSGQRVNKPMMQAIPKLFIDQQDQIMQFYIFYQTRKSLQKIPIKKAVSIAWNLKISKNFLFT